MKIKINKKIILENINKNDELSPVVVGTGLAGGALGILGGSELADHLDASDLVTGGLEASGALLGYGLGRKFGQVIDKETEPEIK